PLAAELAAGHVDRLARGAGDAAVHSLIISKSGRCARAIACARERERRKLDLARARLVAAARARAAVARQCLLLAARRLGRRGLGAARADDRGRLPRRHLDRPLDAYRGTP